MTTTLPSSKQKELPPVLKKRCPRGKCNGNLARVYDWDDKCYYYECTFCGTKYPTSIQDD